MTSLDLFPVRTVFLTVFDIISKNARKLDSLEGVTALPAAFNYQEHLNVRKQALEEAIIDKYSIPETRIAVAIRDLQNEGIIRVQEINTPNEQAEYVTLTDNPKMPSKTKLIKLFSTKI
jgi:hypothetical protein